MTDTGPVVRGKFAWPVRRRPAGPDGTAEDIAVQDIAELEAADRRLPPPAPLPLRESRPRFNLGLLRLSGLGLALVLALTLSLVRVLGGGPPSVAQLRAEAGVDDWTVLPIGVKDDQPGTAFRDKSGAWNGFDIDIAYMIAEDLGFRRRDVRFYSIESEDRARMQATGTDGSRVPVKMVIASFSITADRKAAGINFSGPYLETEQSVVTRTPHKPVSTWKDLSGKTVCSLSSSTSEKAATAAGVTVRSRNKISECFHDLDNNDVEAVTTDAAILAGYKALYPGRYTHWDIGIDAIEKWGVNVGDNEALRTLVDLTLYKSLRDPADDRWERAYQSNLQSEVAANKEGDKFIPIAVAQQPEAVRPYVRQLPWETVLP